MPSGELPPEQYDDLVTDRTKLVAVTAASNILGTMPDVRRITDRAHAAGALTYVDGVHATPHPPIDMAALGADFYATSSYKWSGPHIGAVIARPELLERLSPDKLALLTGRGAGPFRKRAPSPSPTWPGWPQPSTIWPASTRTATGTRRERLLTSMAAVEAHEQAELAHLLKGCPHCPASAWSARLRGAPPPRSSPSPATPRQVAEHLAARKVNVWDGHCYAWELTQAFGIRDAGSGVRAGLVHYNDRSDVDRLLNALEDLT